MNACMHVCMHVCMYVCMHVIVIVIVNLYNATSRNTPQRRFRPDNTKPRSKRMVFKRLRKRGKERPRSSLRRLLGNLFQKDGPTTAKLLLLNSCYECETCFNVLV